MLTTDGGNKTFEPVFDLPVTDLSGGPVMVKVDMGNVYINDAQVVITDIEADNGVIHVIDTVLLPPTK